jgi:uncharacterized protein YcbX
MLVDETVQAMTQRVFPKMALFKSSIDKGLLTITHLQHSMKLDLKNPPASNPISVKIWDDTVSALEVDGSYNQWFSDLLGIRADWFIFGRKFPAS